MKNDNNPRSQKRVKTQRFTPELAVVASSPSRHPANDEQGYYQPHDKFVKCAFRIKEIAIDFFNNHLVDKGLNKHQLENFNLSNSEHQQPFKTKLLSDVVYRGEVEGQTYYIALEHQSSFDRKIIPRLLKYSAALMEEYIEQKPHGHQAIVFPICLYHSPHHNGESRNVPKDKGKSMLEKLFGSTASADKFSEIIRIKVVDLTVMTDMEIKKHGKAAIVEWILKDASLPGDDFLQRVTEHLIRPCYSALASVSDDFKLAMYEYILSVYKGDKSAGELINIMSKVLPEEEEIMLTAAQQLEERGIQKGIQQGRLEGKREFVSVMVSQGDDPLFIKSRFNLSDEEFEQLSPKSEASPSSAQQMEFSPSHGMLAQGMSSSSTTEQLVSSVDSRTIADNPNTNMTFPTDNGPR